MINKIKNDANIALKTGDKDKKLILSTLIGEIQRNEPQIINNQKIWTDDVVFKTIKTLIEANKLCNKLNENEIISIYLPNVLSNTELETIIKEQINNNGYVIKDMGKIMKYLSTNYVSRYDGKFASELIKKMLQ